jgi:hypothetical protein
MLTQKKETGLGFKFNYLSQVTSVSSVRHEIKTYEQTRHAWTRHAVQDLFRKKEKNKNMKI